MGQHIVDQIRDYLVGQIVAHVFVHLKAGIGNRLSRVFSVFNAQQFVLCPMQYQGWGGNLPDAIASVTGIQNCRHLIRQRAGVKTQCL